MIFRWHASNLTFFQWLKDTENLQLSRERRCSQLSPDNREFSVACLIRPWQMFKQNFIGQFKPYKKGKI